MVTAIILSGADASAQEQLADRAQLVGTWKLQTQEFLDEEGAWRPESEAPAEYNRTPNPIGVIHYEESGRMAVQIMSQDRHRFADPRAGTAEEIQEAFSRYISYFGTFEIDEVNKVITHSKLGSLVPNNIGTSVRRPYMFDGPRLWLTVANGRVRLGWVRAD